MPGSYGSVSEQCSIGNPCVGVDYTSDGISHGETVHIWRCVVTVVWVMVVFVPETWVVIREVTVYVPVVAVFSHFSKSICMMFCEGITTKTIKTNVNSTIARTTSATLTFRFTKGQGWVRFPVFISL